jgi:hypothetical protein
MSKVVQLTAAEIKPATVTITVGFNGEWDLAMTKAYHDNRKVRVTDGEFSLVGTIVARGRDGSGRSVDYIIQAPQ